MRIPDRARPGLLATTLRALLLALPMSALAAVPAAYFNGARDEALEHAAAAPGETIVPWFERIQLRASRDDSAQSRRSYAARLRLKTPGQYSAEQDLLALHASRNSATTTAAFSDALKRRYQRLIELYLHHQQQRLGRDRQRLAERAIAAQRAAIGSSTFRPAALQQAELRLAAARRRARIAEHRLQRTRRQIDALSPTTVSLEPGELPPIEGLPAVLHTTDTHNRALDLARIDAAIARQELARERSSGGFGLRFVELRHSSDNSNTSGDNRITIGIDMPLGRSYSSSEKLLQRDQADYRMHQLHRSQQRQREQAEDELMQLLDEYRIQRQGLTDIDSRLARRDRDTPATLTLALLRERLDSRERLALLRADIYRLYIDVLAVSGRLSAEPLRNWLIAGQPVL